MRGTPEQVAGLNEIKQAGGGGSGNSSDVGNDQQDTTDTPADADPDADGSVEGDGTTDTPPVDRLAIRTHVDVCDDRPWHTMTRHDSPIWEEEVVEIFLDPARLGVDSKAS